VVKKAAMVFTGGRLDFLFFARLVAELHWAGADVRYPAHITGHGWRKLMRVPRDLTHRMCEVPPPSALLDFVVRAGEFEPAEAYGNLNMAAGFAVYVPEPKVTRVLELVQRHAIGAWDAGIKEGGTAPGDHRAAWHRLRVQRPGRALGQRVEGESSYPRFSDLASDGRPTTPSTATARLSVLVKHDHQGNS